MRNITAGEIFMKKNQTISLFQLFRMADVKVNILKIVYLKANGILKFKNALHIQL